MAGVLIVLFGACAMGVAATLRGRPDAAGTDWRDAFLWACLSTGAWCVAGTEVLSLGASLSLWPLVAWWGTPGAGLALLLWKRRDQLRAPGRTPADSHTRALSICTLALLAVTGCIAALTPPNTWDAIQYHLPRQFHWLQQGSVAHFSTRDPRQLEMPPLAEFFGANFMALSGSDAWTNLIQWFALAGSAAAASLIARDLGRGPRVQALAALLVVANPAAITEAVNAKNDVLVALWLTILLALAVRMRAQAGCPPARAVQIGLALGLALLTKGTGYILALPVAALIGLWMLKDLRARAVPLGLLVGVVAAAVNVGHWERNYRSFGNPLGLPAESSPYKLTNETFAPAAIASNVVRNIALHTNTPSRAANAAQDRAIGGLHEWLGLGVDDPRTSFMPRVEFRVRFALHSDGNGPAPLHLLLAVLGAALLAVRPGVPGRVALALGAPYAMFLVFCIVLKWQPWHTRLHIPIVTAFAPVGAVVLSRVPWSRLKGAAVALAVAIAAVAVVFNSAKPLLGPRNVFTSTPEEIAFHDNRAVMQAVEAAAKATAALEPGLVALDLDPSPFEYPALRIVREHLSPGARMTNLRRRYGPAPPPGVPDAIVSWGLAPAPGVRYSEGERFLAVAQHLPLTVYARADLVPDEAEALGRLPFVGWTATEGLDRLQGPFPEWDMPVVRWGVAPRTRLTFRSDGSPALLVMECESNVAPDQTVTVLLNGRGVYHHRFPPGRGFHTHRVLLQAKPGDNEVVLRYAHGLENARPPGRAVLFSRLQILPAPEDP